MTCLDAFQVASFPFEDHNCPPIQLIKSFCQSAYSWLKEDIENVVVVHCKAGMARTGVMICSLLLFLKVRFYSPHWKLWDSYKGKFSCSGPYLSSLSWLSLWFYFSICLQFFPTANEAIDYYNQKRCIDGKALVLPSQIVSRLFFSILLSF